MSDPVATVRSVVPWQPFTWKAAAGFASAPFRRTVVVLLISATAGGLAAAWFFSAVFIPLIEQAIVELPDTAAIHGGQLAGVTETIAVTRGRFGLVIEAQPSEGRVEIAPFQVAINRRELRVCSVMGCAVLPYPADLEYGLGRVDMEPRWGAWKPIVITAVGVGHALILLLIWVVVGFFYGMVMRVIAYFADRDLTWRGAWKVGMVIFLPGALLLSGAIVLLGMQAYDVLVFPFFFAAHLVVAWIYVAVVPFQLPRLASAPPASNPFAG